MPQTRPKLQNINVPQYAGHIAVTSRALNAAFTGSTNDCTLLWTGANDTIVPAANSGVTITNSAALGTSVLLTEPGIYLATLTLDVNVTGTPTILAGITNTAVGLNANPAFANGALTLGQVVVVTADDQTSLTLSATVNVTRATPQTIRFMASNGANGAPAANSLLVANCSYSIDRVDIAAA